MPNRRELGYVSAGSTSTIVATTGYGVATGGTTLGSPPSGYTVLEFTADGNLVVSTAGLFDVLMFAGGSGGGASSTQGSPGGGGAGGVIESTIYLAAATYALDVGAGGASHTNGLGSSLNTASRGFGVAGGGRGTRYVADEKNNDGYPGGCGGGGAGINSAGFLPGNLSSNAGVSGFAGGNGFSSNNGGGGGGGGTTAVGANAPSAGVGGAGGAGYDVSTFISGSALYKGGGGGGGALTTGGAGGSSVGGAGGSNVAGSAASANTAGGGGGGGQNNVGGAGGSGIVYVRFKV